MITLCFFFFKQKTAYEMRISDWSSDVCSSDLDAGKALVMIGVLLAGAQILVSMVNLTGLGVSLSTMIVALADNSVWLIALITAVVCMILGMGIPTTAAYVLVAAVLAPALVKRSEERRVGKEGVRTCRSRGAPYH